MVGIEIVADQKTKASFDASHGIGRELCKRTLESGVWLRPLSDVLILMPPLVASENELELLADVTCEAIESFPFPQV